jgi:hypothetical protein
MVEDLPWEALEIENMHGFESTLTYFFITSTVMANYLLPLLDLLYNFVSYAHASPGQLQTRFIIV